MAAVEYLIIGGGHAGVTAAATLRRSGAQGQLLILSAEPEYPYLRYTLSKDFLQGKRPRRRTLLRPPEFYQQQDIQLRTGIQVHRLNPSRRTVALDTGEELAYQTLLLATGASVQRLPILGAELDGVYYLRTLMDAEALRQEMAPDRQVVVIGGGFIGVEVAASLSQNDLHVTLIHNTQTIWSRLFGEAMGRFFHEGLQQRGVTILAPAHVERIEGDGRAHRVITQEGHILPCDFVVIGVGVRPETALAEQAGLRVDNGIVVNEFLESSAEGIFAAGDIARFYSPLFGTYMRIEHWDVAAQQGTTAALNMLGQHQPFQEVPYFFSGLFDIWLEYLGYAPAWDRLTIRRHGLERFAAFYSQGPYIRGVLLVNNSRELQTCRELIRQKSVIEDFSVLENPAVDLGHYSTQPRGG
jgi:3-phenylpropionate/trans-cinnamate dioxygenase ferredoxin reductase component